MNFMIVQRYQQTIGQKTQISLEVKQYYGNFCVNLHLLIITYLTFFKGRDLEPTSIGGTWLALNVRGRFAALLNINELNNQPNAISRGNLVEHFVKGNTTALEYMSGLQDVYKGFKLITVTMRLKT